MSEQINCYRVEFADNTGIIGSTKEFSKTKKKVLARNDYYLCLDDLSFTSLEVKSIGKASVWSYASDRVWGNRIHYTLYTFKNVRTSTIKRHIEKHIKEKYGYFSKGLDLSFITDAEAV